MEEEEDVGEEEKKKKIARDFKRVEFESRTVYWRQSKLPVTQRDHDATSLLRHLRFLPIDQICIKHSILEFKILHNLT